MRIPSATLDEIRDAVKLSSVVGEHVIWDKRKTRASQGHFWCCCPVHSEKSPSFHVDDRKGFAHCFGCGWSGDAYKFLTERTGKTFPEAVEELAKRAGITLPESTPESRAIAARRLTLVEVNEAAASWFQEQLGKAPQVKAYAASRGLSPEELSAFRIGYAPAGNRLVNSSIAGVDEMVAAGVLGRSDDGGRLYDRFTDRLMFPITTLRGQVVAFSGRALSADAQAKYLNTPETEIFDKGATLFNASTARAAAWEGAQLVAVEGQIDVIAATRVGHAAVAPMGTALTEAHVTQLAKFSEAPVLCFDGDAAGRKAQARAIDLILPAASGSFTARFSVLPDGQDPDSMVRRSPEAYRAAVDGAMSLADALWQRETAQPVTAPEQRAKLEGKLRDALRTIKDPDTRRAYGQDFKERLAMLGKRPTLYRSNSYSQHSTSPSSGRLVMGFSRGSGLSLREAMLVTAIAAAPQAAMDRVESLNADDRLSPAAVALINSMVMAISSAPDTAVAEVLEAAGLTGDVQDAVSKALAAGVEMAIGSEAPAALQIIAGTVRH